MALMNGIYKNNGDGDANGDGDGDGESNGDKSESERGEGEDSENEDNRSEICQQHDIVVEILTDANNHRHHHVQEISMFAVCDDAVEVL